MSTPVFVVLP